MWGQAQGRIALGLTQFCLYTLQVVSDAFEKRYLWAFA